jgi:hypothetical protein
LEAVDLIVCWKAGDPTMIRETERTGYLGGEVEVNLDEEGLVYQNGDTHYIDIVQVAPLLGQETITAASD